MAMKTIQAAYDDVVSSAEADYTQDGNGVLASGRIHLMPGDHQVGTGVVFEGGRAVEITGTLSGVALRTTSSRLRGSCRTRRRPPRCSRSALRRRPPLPGV